MPDVKVATASADTSPETVPATSAMEKLPPAGMKCPASEAIIDWACPLAPTATVNWPTGSRMPARSASAVVSSGSRPT